MVEVAEERVTAAAPPVIRSEPQLLGEVRAEGLERFSLPLAEFSRVLGGGLVPGSLVLIGGEPGIGKSTLLLQVSSIVATTLKRPVLYVSGEESARQIKMRADRLGVPTDGLYVLSETVLEAILHHAERLSPVMMVVDSIQTITSGDLPSAAGSVTQVREAAARLQWWAKSSGVVVFLVGHVTKEGAIAGPKVLEHIVDTVLYLEGDPFHTYRLLRTTKNRFGATSEVGVFEMRGGGTGGGGEPLGGVPGGADGPGARFRHRRHDGKGRGRCWWRSRPSPSTPVFVPSRRTATGWTCTGCF
jgi:DNA replication and repair protein RadA